MKSGGPLRRMSEKRKAQLPARRRCVQIVLARDKTCRFGPRLDAYWAIHGLEAYRELVGGIKISGCWGPLDVHEPGHRSHGADPTDPDQCILLCRGHHQEIAHGRPLLAKALGL